ncbi:MAG: hypothetical protein KAJ18_11675 [Candidatus Omnitrophica bacterium]|nr:hypothetical protein [Candidatus Omnitrophota bacterium]
MKITDRYKNLIETDLLDPILSLLNNQSYQFNSSGRLEADMRMQSETPWIHVRQGIVRNCGMWHQVWFNFYKFIPSYCQKCWKVVIRPHTLIELFQLYEILVELDLPSKCGIEKRYTVGALYGGYMYNDSKEEGLECKNMIERIVHKRIGPHVKVFLKRACTEFEHKFGDSSKWTVTEEQKRLESQLERLFMDQGKSHAQSDAMERHIMANWVKFAFAQGDPTANDFSDKPLYPPYVTYEE